METSPVQIRDDYQGFVARIPQRPLVTLVLWAQVAWWLWFLYCGFMDQALAPDGLVWAYWLLLPLTASGLFFRRYLYVRGTPTRLEVTGWVGTILRPQTVVIPLDAVRVEVFRSIRVSRSPATVVWIQGGDGRWRRLGRLQASKQDLAPLVDRIEAQAAHARPGLFHRVKEKLRSDRDGRTQPPGSSGHATLSSPG